jgi:hypothetical protein
MQVVRTLGLVTVLDEWWHCHPPSTGTNPISHCHLSHTISVILRSYSALSTTYEAEKRLPAFYIVYPGGCGVSRRGEGGAPPTPILPPHRIQPSLVPSSNTPDVTESQIQFIMIQDDGEDANRPLRSFHAVCVELRERIDAFLSEKPQTPLLRNVQAQLRVSMGVVEEALGKYQCVFLQLCLLSTFR